MIFSDSKEDINCTDGVALVKGTFNNELVSALVVDRSVLSNTKISGLDSDLDRRVGEQAKDNGPLILLPNTTPDGTLWSDKKTEQKATNQKEDDWQELLCFGESARATELASTLGQMEFSAIGGDPQSPIALVIAGVPRGHRPPVRVLHHLPGTHVGGLNPFFSAIGAEPFAIMDSVEPLLVKLSEKGSSWVGVLSRAGAFLWNLDLKGRVGLENLSCLRVDEDVILPITAGLEAGAHVELSTDIAGLLPRARSGDLDVSFIVNPISEEELKYFTPSVEVPNHVLQFPVPFAVATAN